MHRLSLFLLLGLIAACAPHTALRTDAGLTLVHLNDTYRLDAVEDGNAGGFGRVVTVIRDLKENGRDVRITHGGDFMYPSLESNLWNGMQIVDAFNLMDDIAPLYAVAGNHEFDRRTPEHLQNAVRASRFDWLGDNYRFVTGDRQIDDALKSAYTFHSQGRKIGVFSLTLHADDGGNERAYAPVDKRYLEIAEDTIDKLENAGADVIIGLTHLHIWQDQEIANLRAAHPKFMFVVGGHEHEPEFYPMTATTAAVVKGASNARVIWAIDIDFNEAANPSIQFRRIALNADIQPDAEFQVLEDKYRRQILQKFPFLEARVGVAAMPLDGREVAIRNGETNWGNFIADQMRAAFGKPQADFAFINGGSLRIDDVIDGDIHFEDIGRTFGFSSYLRHMSISGAEFRSLMEAGYVGFGPSKGYFPQISGFRVCVDRSLEEHHRIVSLQVPVGDGWSEIDPDKLYGLVIPDFLYNGGDGYRVPKSRPASRPGSELKYLVLDGILRIQAAGGKVGVAVDEDSPRYDELSGADDVCFSR